MAEVTVSQFAEVLKVPVDRLLVQLDQAGIKVSGPDARISDDAKLELLTHLRRSHGSEADGDAAPPKMPAAPPSSAPARTRRDARASARSTSGATATGSARRRVPRPHRSRASASPPPPPSPPPLQRSRPTTIKPATAARSCTS